MNETAHSSVTAEELADTIAEFEKYRARLHHETVQTAKKAKISQKTMMAQLQPQLDRIDNKLEALRAQYKALVNG